MVKYFENLNPSKRTTEDYIKECESDLSSHFNDEFDLYVGYYFEGNRHLGIYVMSSKEENIDNFVSYWVKQGYLKFIKREN